MTTLKHCPKCERDMHPAFFCFGLKGNDNPRIWCDDCRQDNPNAYKREIYAQTRKKTPRNALTHFACKKCHAVKPNTAEFFQPEVYRGRQRLRSVCRSCRAKLRKNRIRSKPIVTTITGHIGGFVHKLVKKCVDCHVEFDRRGLVGNRRFRCRPCNLVRKSKKRAEERAVRLAANPRPYSRSPNRLPGGLRICTGCKRTLPENTQFFKPRPRAGQFYTRCWSCYSIGNRERKVRATPSWMTLDQIREINHLYRTAKAISVSSGVQMHVDHYHPLNGKDRCGLHVPWNMRVIPATENLAKKNLSPDIANDRFCPKFIAA